MCPRTASLDAPALPAHYLWQGKGPASRRKGNRREPYTHTERQSMPSGNGCRATQSDAREQGAADSAEGLKEHEESEKTVEFTYLMRGCPVRVQLPVRKVDKAHRQGE
ncbi:uncharacterized protein Tco025E_03692 [Trypanosoma conorhini]|uniref:Uncharacterized protein n=1 Tax=Trypanosoma conorhini TaxID=83891 RepID=A0A422PSE5_9TRYP|nr:uncharacterized protein Tco025E_03692 [Trypanosoma conorhini]RNF20665.1 hypothetical protein Tco025E_03692 [Trypanosoma conorhini]